MFLSKIFPTRRVAEPIEKFYSVSFRPFVIVVNCRRVFGRSNNRVRAYKAIFFLLRIFTGAARGDELVMENRMSKRLRTIESLVRQKNNQTRTEVRVINIEEFTNSRLCACVKVKLVRWLYHANGNAGVFWKCQPRITGSTRNLGDGFEK